MLWRYQNDLRAGLDRAAPQLPMADRPGGGLDAVIRALANYSPAQCKHALDINAIEAKCLRDQGDDALKFLNGSTNWKPEQLQRAIGSSAAAIRKRYKRAAGGNGRNRQEHSTRKLKNLGAPSATETR